MKVFSKRLKELRKEKKLTQKEIAEQIGIKRNTYSDWETGKNEPNFENLIKLADFFEVSLDWLFGRKVELGEEE
ncbi:helix-turn-helix domain-containing protein [Streptococcus peroris]|uniref:helix-turn-helix domain-containing protein n=1 Tax=Streptococcus peroris TaxID=68891 RepID=UPI0039C32BE8